MLFLIALNLEGQRHMAVGASVVHVMHVNIKINIYATTQRSNFLNASIMKLIKIMIFYMVLYLHKFPSLNNSKCSSFSMAFK